MLTQSQEDFQVNLRNETYIGLWMRREVIIPLVDVDYKIPVKRGCLAENEEEAVKVKVVVTDGVAHIESCHPKYFYQF
jgi:hypothetical protein